MSKTSMTKKFLHKNSRSELTSERNVINYCKNSLLLIKQLLTIQISYNSIQRKYNTKKVIIKWRASLLGSEHKVSVKSLIPIEILVVATKKDFDILPYAIQFAINNSQNQILKVTIICPAVDISEIYENYLQSVVPKVKINFLPEEDVVLKEIRESLIQIFKLRSGWMLQQFLKVEFCLKSQARGILVLDADTILLRPQIWLDDKNSQILMPSLEFHEPYYDFLNRAFNFKKYPKYTFVSHHMLIQPYILREIFGKLGLDNLENLFSFVIKFAIKNEASPVCLEYELYAQGLLKFFPKLVSLVKFSNISVVREEILGTNIKLEVLESYKKVYNSITAHSYLVKEKV
jgi:hypothetical protein